MMKLSERIRVLEEAGIDTSKYNLKISGIEVEIDAVNSIVEDKQVDNKKLFRRWITAQTFKMLNSASFNNKKGCMESGWDAYLRNCYDYKYQFTMMLEELKTLSKLYNTDKDEFNERSHFFNKDVVVATCNHYIAQLTKYVYQKQKDGKIKLAQYGCVKVDDIDDLFIDKLRNIIENIGLIDLQKANLGDIEGDRYEASEDGVKSIIDRLDIYYEDYIFNGLEETLEQEHNIDVSNMSWKDLYNKVQELDLGYDMDIMPYIFGDKEIKLDIDNKEIQEEYLRERE